MSDQTIETAIRSVLLANSEIASLVVDRIYNGEAPTDPTYPLIIFALDSRGSVMRHGGGASACDLDLSAFSRKSLSEARAIGDLIRSALTRRRHVMGNASFIMTDCISGRAGAIDKIDAFGDEVKFTGFYST